MSPSYQSSSSPSHSEFPPASESEAQEWLSVCDFSDVMSRCIFSLVSVQRYDLQISFFIYHLFSFFSSIFLTGAEVVAQRCGRSKPVNNRPFMMPCNAMMILLCPPPPTLHQPPQLHRNVVQQVTHSPPPPPCHHHQPSLPPPSPHHRGRHRNLSPYSPNKKGEKERNYRGGKLFRRSTKRGFMVGHIHSQRKKRGTHLSVVQLH